MSRKAFTLVELLVVISIIGLLSTIAVVSLGSARKQARNTRRLADVKQLVTAFSLGLDASSSGTYPSTGGDIWACISSTCTGGWAPASPQFLVNTTVDDFIHSYMPTKPTDPIGGTSRGQSGYIYNGGYPGGPGYAGNFTAGPYIDFLLEPTTSCGFGRIWAQTANYTDCLYNLAQ